jgi:hypothetical protein
LRFPDGDAYNPAMGATDEDDEQPVAWNPLTPGGVASFANAPLGQLLSAQGAAAFLLWLTMMFYLSQSWVPAIDETIEALPAGSRIADGKLHIPNAGPVHLSDNRLISILWTTVDAPGTVSDIQIRLTPAGWQISALFGYISLPYPKLADYSLDRDALSPRWGAWRPAIIPIVAGLGVIGVWIGWVILAAIYAWPIRVAVFFRDKLTSRLGCWKLCSAALLPGALLLTAAILFYSLGKIPVAGLTIAFAAHFVLGWSYLICGAFALPLLPEAAQLQGNPFTPNHRKKKRDRNPFRKKK